MSQFAAFDSFQVLLHFFYTFVKILFQGDFNVVDYINKICLPFKTTLEPKSVSLNGISSYSTVVYNPLRTRLFTIH